MAQEQNLEYSFTWLTSFGKVQLEQFGSAALEGGSNSVISGEQMDIWR